MHSDKKPLAPLALAALGVVFGDIGTSPLYAMTEVFAGTHPVPITPANVLGILSLVFWSLIAVVSVKYVGFVMRADNRGEGGIMALMALALRDLEEGSRRHRAIVLAGICGAALFYGDGVVTPAISVLGAVEGLKVASPAFASFVIPITVAIVVALFTLQRKGTASVGMLFGPIMLVWFVVLAVLGVYNIVREPAVLAALNPARAFDYAQADPRMAFLSLGGVVLTLTGAEALYADMGHFGRKPIVIGWYGLVLPSLMITYLGQGALLIHDAKAIDNPFYHMAPDWALYPLLLLATVAAIIASQAVITGAYSMTRQAIQLGYSPRMEVRHTSVETIGQIYMPAINWLLMVSVVALVLGFKSSANLGAAYGIAVTGTMVITAVLEFVVIRHLWRWSLWRALPVIVLFLAIDLAFFAANAIKIEDGGWFPLVFGLFVFILLTTWRRGRRLFAERVQEEAIDLDQFIAGVKEFPPQRVPGTAVFMTPNPKRVPFALLHSMKHYKVLHERIVMLTVEVMDVPHVADANRVAVEHMGDEFHRVKVFFGFMDDTDLPRALEWCAEGGLDFDLMDTTFFLGRETLIPTLGKDMAYWRELLFVALFRNATTATAFFRIPANRVVELGSQVIL